MRREVEPAPPSVDAAFLLAWQRVQTATRSPSANGGGRPRPARSDAVYEVIDQLAGAAIPASALETLVLPGRVPGYSPALLDELTAAGEVVWSGAGALPGSDGWIALVPAQTAQLLLPDPGEITTTPVHAAILSALEGGGALFFRTIADRVAATRDDSARALAATDREVAVAIWDLVWAGLVTNDTLAPLRTVLGSGRPVAPSADGSSRRAAGRPGAAISRRPGFGRGAMPSHTRPPTGSGPSSALPPPSD